MSCNLQGNKITLSYAFSNRDFIGNTALFVRIGTIRNAAFAGDIGGFTITT